MAIDRSRPTVKSLRGRGVLAAPVINSTGKLVGMLEAQELVSFLTGQRRTRPTNGALSVADCRSVDRLQS